MSGIRQALWQFYKDHGFETAISTIQGWQTTLEDIADVCSEEQKPAVAMLLKAVNDSITMIVDHNSCPDGEPIDLDEPIELTDEDLVDEPLDLPLDLTGSQMVEVPFGDGLDVPEPSVS